MQRVVPLPLKFIFILFLVGLAFHPSTHAREGAWVLEDYDYLCYMNYLPSYSQWQFNSTRGPNDLWVINLTISGYSLSPTTVLVCNETGYTEWKNTSSTSACQLVRAVNWSLNTQIELPYQSRWHLILNNTGSVALYFALVIAHFHWYSTPPPTTPTDTISNLSGWFLIFAALVVILVPCVCGCSCIRRVCRIGRGSKSEATKPVVVFLNREREDDSLYEEDDSWE